MCIYIYIYINYEFVGVMNEQELAKIRRNFGETNITFPKNVYDFWPSDVINE
jgi:hypothetical protein